MVDKLPWHAMATPVGPIQTFLVPPEMPAMVSLELLSSSFLRLGAGTTLVGKGVPSRTQALIVLQKLLERTLPQGLVLADSDRA